VLDAVNKAVPTKTINSNKKRLPWITKEIKALIRKRNKLFRKKKNQQMKKAKENTKHVREPYNLRSGKNIGNT